MQPAPRPRPRSRRASPRGAMSVTVGFSTLILASMSVACIAIGSFALHRMEVSNAANAVALTCLSIAKRQGLPAAQGNHPAVSNVANGNSRVLDLSGVNCPTLQRVTTNDGRTLVVAQSQGDINNTQGGNLVDLVAQDLNGVAFGELNETVISEVRRPQPQLVLVMDYSGSMAAPFDGGTRTQVLVEITNELLDDMADAIAFGAVLFDSDVRGIAISPGFDPDQDLIRQLIQNNQPTGSTNYASPMRTAISLLDEVQNANQPTYIMFIGDGAPNRPDGDPAGQARTQADIARNKDHTIFSLNIGGGGAQRDLLLYMAGDKQNRASPNHYFEATNRAELRAVFRGVRDALFCRIPNITPKPEDPDDVFAFIREEDNEFQMERVADALDPQYDQTFSWELVWSPNPDEPAEIRLSKRACNRMLDEEGSVILRYGGAKLLAGLPQ